MSWTYTITSSNGVQNVYATGVEDVSNYDAVNWGIDPKLARVDRVSTDGQTVEVYEAGWARGDDYRWYKKASGPGETMPGWMLPAAAVFAVIGAFGLGMWFLDRIPDNFGAEKLFPRRSNEDPTLVLESHYPAAGQEIDFNAKTGLAVVTFTDENGKTQKHHWLWRGDHWQCAKEFA